MLLKCHGERAVRRTGEGINAVLPCWQSRSARFLRRVLDIDGLFTMGSIPEVVESTDRVPSSAIVDARSLRFETVVVPVAGVLNVVECCSSVFLQLADSGVGTQHPLRVGCAAHGELRVHKANRRVVSP